MEITMDYEFAKKYVSKHGLEGFFFMINDKYPDSDFYTMSTDWYEIGREYICKFKGGNGDLLIYWQ